MKTRRLIRLTIAFAALIVVVYVLNFIGVGFLFYPHMPSLRKEFMEARREQRPVHLTIKAVDQFGAPASGYKVKVILRYMSWYFGLFPRWSQHSSSYIVTTNESGIGKLSPWCHKALFVQFKELDGTRYVFPNGKHDPYNMSFNNNPQGPLNMKILDRADQIIDMMVLRHDPPVKLTPYRPEIPGRGSIGRGSGGVEIEAQDEMVFTVDVTGNKLLEGRQPGDMVITVRNAKAACDLFLKRYTPGLNFNPDSEWDVSCEALNGTVIQQAESNQIITFAPETGYKKRLHYTLQIKREMSRAESDESHSSGGAPFKLVRSASDQDDYISIGPGEACGAHLFLRHDNPRWYGIVNAGFGAEYRKGKLGINADGAYNPTGSTNLWTGSPHLPEGY